MCDLVAKARFLVETVLAHFIFDSRIHLPRPAQGSGLSNAGVREIVLGLTGEIADIARSEACVTFQNHRLKLTTGWCCERWCSVYLLLKPVIRPPLSVDEPILEALSVSEAFHWPDSIPSPQTENDELVSLTNRAYQWVAIAAVLHEIGHVANAGSGITGPELELTCDRFASLYLLGRRDNPGTDVQMLGAALWLCCLCSESLNSSQFLSRSHPNPVERLHCYLTEFVNGDSETGKAVWTLCAAHVIKLARIHNRASLDDEVVNAGHATLDAWLRDLRSCW